MYASYGDAGDTLTSNEGVRSFAVDGCLAAATRLGANEDIAAQLSHASAQAEWCQHAANVIPQHTVTSVRQLSPWRLLRAAQAFQEDSGPDPVRAFAGPAPTGQSVAGTSSSTPSQPIIGGPPHQFVSNGMAASTHTA